MKKLSAFANFKSAFANFKMAFADTYIGCFAVCGLLVSERSDKTPFSELLKASDGVDVEPCLFDNL